MVGEIRRRQVDHRHCDHRPDRAARPHRRRRGAAARAAHRQSAARADAQDPRQADRHGVPGPADQPQSALPHRRTAHRNHPDAFDLVGIAAGAAKGALAARRSRHPGPRHAHRRLSAPVLRRHAPARGAGARARRRAGTGHRRRADHRARRLGAGADHRAVEAAVRAAWRRRDADHARHGRDRRDRRPRRGDVCGPHRRDRPGARRHQGAAASLHQGPDGLDPDADRRERPAGADSRLDAAPDRDPARLRLPSALPARLRPLPDVPARVAAGERIAGRLLALHPFPVQAAAS